MGKATNFATTINWAYTPDFKTIQISTKRPSAIDANDIMGESFEEYLTGVESSPKILANRQVQQMLMQGQGLEGSQIQIWELRIRKCAHIEDGNPVDKLPDIQIHDHVVIDGAVHVVKWADTTHRLSFGEILLVYISEDIA